MKRIKVPAASVRAKAERDRAEREGAAARKMGITVGQNPYSAGPLWTGWRVGWFQALPAATEVAQVATSMAETAEALLEALQRLRRRVKEGGGVPRYTVTPGAALNAIIEGEVDPAIARAKRAGLKGLGE